MFDDRSIGIPQIRVEDISGMTPEKREELRRELQSVSQEEPQRRIREDINKKRARNGLPPLAEPPHPPEDKAPPPKTIP